MTSAKTMIFGFENEYKDDLHFVPMGMRYRLDLAGIKVSLEDWLKLPVSERFSLLAMPADAGQDIDVFRKRLLELMGGITGQKAIDIPKLDDQAWSSTLPCPKCIRDACESKGMTFEEVDWTAFSDLQRYALWKLAKSRRQPEAFLLALREFLSKEE